ncbi:uncharacterized protein LOC129873710 isoform X11 [Solanum dulcamara]|uniref:uncharacterized protein LOC129873710 isoform X11 n=1 Tax=Solanum dulcamara TaxID=45834 RepID=UPI00248654D1|nr:uncharacterized protein LOC129873710 isoform X11 [Solanum dulcamara]
MLHLVKHKTYLRARPLYRHLERDMTLIVWPMNLWCGPGMSMPQTPPYLDIQELLNLVFQATHTLAPQDLIPTPLANQQYPCQGAKKKKVHHLFSRALVLETQHLASYIATPENYIPGSGGKIQSICGMQTYKDKSQEELRFEDYQLGDKVTFYKPFSFVDSTDIVLMIIGTIATIGNGLSLPNMTVLFGEWTDSFGQNQNNKDALGVVSRVSLKFVYLALGCGAGAFLCFSNKESLSETI